MPTYPPKAENIPDNPLQLKYNRQENNFAFFIEFQSRKSFNQANQGSDNFPPIGNPGEPTILLALLLLHLVYKRN
jgi:hypothetical protein